MGIGYRIKEARENLGITQVELGERVGVTGSAITNYEKDTSHPKEDIICRLMEVLNVDANYLFQDMVEINKKKREISFSEYHIIEKYRELDDNGRKYIDSILIHELERVRQIKNSQPKAVSSSDLRAINYYYRLASAGTGQIVFDVPPSKKIEIPNIPRYRKADYAIGVNGDSMEPIYSDGDILLVEMTDQIDVGEIGIFLVDNECFVKKLGNGELISLNPMRKNIKLNEDSKCMGRVIDTYKQ